MTTVVTMTAYNRPQYLQQSLDSWAAAEGMEDTLLILSLEPNQPEVAMVAKSYPHRRQVVVNTKRKGVLANPWWALERAFAAEADFAILAEDDVIVSADVLTYFEFCARKYENDPTVLLIAGFSPCGCSLEEDIDPMEGVCSTAAVHRGNLTSPTPWGIWRERWPELRDSWDFTYEHNGFDHRIQSLRGDRDVIRPCSSRAQHIGREDGAHCLPSMFDGLLSHTFRPTYPPRDFYEGDGRFPVGGPAGSVGAIA